MPNICSAPECSEPILREDPRALYCSPRCRSLVAGRLYRSRNAAYIAAWQASYRERNRDELAAAKATYHARNREHRQARSRAWALANPEKAAASSAAWRARNRLRVAETQRRRASRIRGNASTSFSSVEMQARIDYFGGRCWMCGGEATSVDHVKPIAVGGPHMLSNLRPACVSCNSRKHARWYGVAELARFRAA